MPCDFCCQKKKLLERFIIHFEKIKDLMMIGGNNKQ